MNQTLRNMTQLCAPLLMMWGASACGSNSVEEPDPITVTLNEVYLSLSLLPIGGTRSTFHSESESIEDIEKFRVVVLDKENKIEATAIITDVDSDNIYAMLRVTPDADNTNSKKTIFAIANEEMVSYNSTDKEGIDFDNWVTGYAGVKTDIQNCVFTFDDSKNIPMTGMTEIDLTGVKAGETVNTTLNLVRVATKFELEIINNLEDNLRVTDVTISNLADKQYLMPHFNRDSSNGGVISVEGKKDFYFGYIDDPFNTAGGLLSWDKWLKSAVEESQQTSGTYNIADRRGWIMEYDSPQKESEHTSKDWAELKDENVTVASECTATLPIHYYAESRSGILGSEAGVLSGDEESGEKLIHTDAAGHQQSYDMSITLQRGSETRVFSKTLYNVRALFRNTHVKVVLTITGSGETVQTDWHIYTRQWHLKEQPLIVM